MHEKFGEGQVANLLGTDEKIYLAIAKLHRLNLSKLFLNIRKNL